MSFQTLNDCLTTRFVYDGANAVLELNASNQVIWAWVNAPGLDQPIERIAFINGTPRTRQVFHADGLGSIAALTDESGATVQTYTYTAFGSIRTQTGADLNRITYTAREAMGDTLGFFYYRHRIYDPNTGRFTSEDLLGFVDGANLYGYVANNPETGTDPLGLQAILFTPWWAALLEEPPIVPRVPPGWCPKDPVPEGFKPPSTPRGNWSSKFPKESLRDDMGHEPGVRPHWDYKDPSGRRWRIFEDGTREPKSVPCQGIRSPEIG